MDAMGESMFCTKCGAQLEDGAKFCTFCGAAVRTPGQPVAPSASESQPSSEPRPVPEPQPVPEPWSEPAPQPEPRPNTAQPAPASHPQPDRTPVPEQPDKPKRKLGKKGKIAVAVVVVCLIAAAVVGVIVLRPDDSRVEASYGQHDGLECSVSTTIVPKDSKGRALDKYTVSVTPKGKNARGGKSYKIKVSGAGGFTMGDFPNLSDGDYDMVVTPAGDKGADDGARTIKLDYEKDDDDAPQTVEVKPNGSAGKVDGDKDASGSSEKAAQKTEANYTVESKSIDASFPAAGEEDYTVQTTFDYPQFSAGKNTPTAGIEKLNAMFEKNAEEALSSAKSWTMGGDQQAQRYRDTCTNIDGNIACVRSYRYTSGGGVHGTDDFSATFYNLDTGEEVSLEDATGMSFDDLESAAEDAIDEYLDGNPSDIYEDDIDEHVEEVAEQESRYYVCKDGIVVMAGDYELGSFAFGTHEIMVKSDNADLVGTDVSGVYATNYGN